MTSVEERVRALADESPTPPSVTAVMARGSQLRSRRRARRIAAAAALAVAIIVWPVVSFGVFSPSSRSEASAFLTLVAAKSGAQPALGSADAKFWYSQSRIVYGGLAYTRQVWLGHNSGGRLIQNDGIICETTSVSAMYSAGGRGLTWDQLLALPRDPNRLYEWLMSAVGNAGHDRYSEMFVTIGDLLRESPATPALRQSLYQVAARIPGVSLTPGLTDAAGRPATGVGRGQPDGGGTVTYLIDSQTGALLEERDINSDGSLALKMTFVLSGPTTSTTALPQPSATRSETAAERAARQYAIQAQQAVNAARTAAERARLAAQACQPSKVNSGAGSE